MLFCLCNKHVPESTSFFSEVQDNVAIIGAVHCRTRQSLFFLWPLVAVLLLLLPCCVIIKKPLEEEHIDPNTSHNIQGSKHLTKKCATEAARLS